MIIHRDIAEHLFTGFSIKRWNDLVRPMELNEMDRRAFAIITAYFMAKLEEEQGHEVDWDIIIDHSVFDLLRKIAISDIKESVHRDIRTNYPVEYRKLNEWVASSVSPMLDRYGLAESFHTYLLGGEEHWSPTQRRSRHILEAARTYSSHREFQIIKAVNHHDPRVPGIEDDLRRRLEPFLDLTGMRQLVLELDLYRLISVIDRLRYQA
ncbi:MAG: hydrolase, partial [Spirochaetota bacterium]